MAKKETKKEADPKSGISPKKSRKVSATQALKNKDGDQPRGER